MDRVAARLASHLGIMDVDTMLIRQTNGYGKETVIHLTLPDKDVNFVTKYNPVTSKILDIQKLKSPI